MHRCATLSPDQVESEASAAGNDVDRGLELAARVGAALPQPGAGRTWLRWSLLAAAAKGDLTAARILEAHSDALAILAEAGEQDPDGTWGVFAAEAPGQRLDAVESADGTRLRGTKPWCSLGDVLENAVLTAQTGDGRRLYAVDLRHPSVHADPPSTWVARGLAAVTSAALHFDDTPARPVGGPGWYLTRSGFAWGGMGVAACWYGGALGLYDTLVGAAHARDDQLSRLQVGTVDVALHAAAATLRRAAYDVDAGVASGASGSLLALRVRAVVAQAVETTLRQCGHALGPAPLAFDEVHARRVADLELYVRQHHAERDLAALGAALVEEG
jgi:alkylation response protein AidB-like acyl-CoA dehydrogenase